ncbi:hypothetical protein ACSFA0_19640 [Variovorax sp. LT1P1]|uniref:hypothetical protein n=1 Tax=Variovorax sp. LT1P1 TaxID=3443730 RepID=UPI003F4834B9
MFNQAALHLGDLKKSPVFSMSRGGRELFHTNFWAFILEINPDDLEEDDRPVAHAVRGSLLESLFGEVVPSRVWVWREKNNLDLVVIAAPDTPAGQTLMAPQIGAQEFAKVSRKRKNTVGLPEVGTRCVVVEVKLKAIPTRLQLDSYTQKLLDGLTFDLPQPAKLAPDTYCSDWGRVQVQLDHAEHTGVKFWAYPPSVNADDQLIDNRLKPALAGAAGSARLLLIAPGADAELVDNSPWQVEQPIDIMNAMIQAFDSALHEHSERPQGLFTAIVKDYLDSTKRLCQIVDEVQREVSASFCADEGNVALSAVHRSACHKRFIDARLHDLVGKQAYSVMQKMLFRSLLDHELHGFRLHAETILTRGTPGFNIEYVKQCPAAGNNGNNAVRLGVQIQGGLYRHYIAASLSTEQLLRAIAEDPDAGGWLGGNREQHGVFGERRFFGSTKFVYRERDISALTWQPLRQMIELSITEAAQLLQNADMRQRLIELVK